MLDAGKAHDELPSGWAWARLDDLGVWTGGGTPSKAVTAFWTEGTIPWVSPKDMKEDYVGDEADRITPDAIGASAVKLVRSGSLLCVVRSGILQHTFPVAIAACDVTVNQDMRVLTPHDGFETRYLQLYLRSQNRQILKACAKDGTTVASIDGGRLGAVQVPLAPLNEQRRIVAKVEELFGEIEAGEQELEKAREGLAAYRRSILKAAVTGELTREWREKNPPNETGADLLTRILTERRAIWERAELAKMEAKGQRPTNNGWKSRYPQPIAPGQSKLPKLPEGWTWGSIDQLTKLVGGITVDAKRNGSEQIEVPYLRVANVQRGFLDLREIKTIRAEPAKIAQLRLRANDVLLNEGGDRDKVGRGWVWSDEIEECIHQNHIFRARPTLPEVDGRFISFYANESGQRYFLEGAKQTTNLASISLSKVARLPVPLPPASEIRVIVASVTEFLDLITEEESRIIVLEAEAVRVRQSILNAAFLGKLVPQDPADEPASALLARVQAQGDTEPRPRTRRQRASVETRA